MENQTRMKWVRVKIPSELHALFKRVAKDLDVNARSLAHFVQLSMQERSDRILGENEQKRLYGRIQTTPTEDNGDDV